MRDEFSAVEFDGDQAVAEAVAGLDEARSTRGGLFRGAGVLAGAGIGAALLPSLASARNGGSKKNDVKILNYALTLEYLESAFYQEALARGSFTGSVLNFAQVVAGHEATHEPLLDEHAQVAVLQPCLLRRGMGERSIER